MDVHQVYGLNTQNLLDSIAVDNLFIRQLYNLTIESAKNLKVVSFIMRDRAQNRGEVQQRGISAADKSVIDICKLTPLLGVYGSRTLLDEVAHYRADSMGFLQQDPYFAKAHAEMLMADYLLSACLCYVEVFSGSRVDKFLATRNRFIAGAVANMAPEDTTKFISYLQATPTNYHLKQVKVLKLTANKKGFRVTQSSSYLDFNRNVVVTPVFFMLHFVDGIMEILRHHIVKFRYIKDNLTERELVSTTNPEILLRYYDQEFVQKVMANIGTMYIRGYIKIPELGISKYDHTGVRALDLSRITSVELVDSFDTRFIDVDFNIILPTFKETVSRMNNPLLTLVYEDLVGKPPQTRNILELRNALTAYVEGQVAIGTTTALRHLHLYMMQRPQVFTTYNGGKRPEFAGFGFSNSFNLGGAKE